MKISMDQFIDFCERYQKQEFPHQRYGQAFVNWFGLTQVPDLFYEEDDTKAYKIMEDYLNGN